MEERNNKIQTLMTLKKTVLEIIWLPKMHARILLHVSPSNKTMETICLFQVNNKKCTEYFWEHRRYSRMQRSKATEVCNCMFITVHTKVCCYSRFFPLGVYKNNQNYENCNRKQYSFMETENGQFTVDVTTSLNITSYLKKNLS